MQLSFNVERPFLEERDAIDLVASARTRLDWTARRDAARSWTSAYKRSNIANTKETSLQATFLHRVFVDVLGYVDQGAGRSTWTLVAEPTTDIEAKFPDGSLGFFTGSGGSLTKVVIELKDALTDLDAKQMSRRDRLSPVDQGFQYLSRYENADFVIVSNFLELRLYSKRFGIGRFHRFDLTALDDENQLGRLVGLCGAETLIGTSARMNSPLLDRLGEAAPRSRRTITDTFYEIYANYRDRIVVYLADAFPARRDQLVQAAQKYLDRVIFIAYAEGVGLLPARILSETLELGRRSRSRSPAKVWEQLLYLFEDIDKGRDDLSPTINRYNGGLFAHDALLDDELSLPDDLVGEAVRFTEFDFRTEVDVNILGHIFEMSIADIEALHQQVSLDPRAVNRDGMATDARRRQFGVFYTPSWVTHFIIDQTLGRLLQDDGPAVRHSLKILDPACGSGAFLSEALNYFSSYSAALAAEALLAGEASLFNPVSTERPSSYIHQLFGIDILAESVEITKLSLWLKSASESQPLDVIETVVHGNALVPPDHAESVAKTPVEDVRVSTKFDVVVGNPPWGSSLDYELDANLALSTGQFDSYELFVERSLDAYLRDGGYFGFIIPDRILRPEGWRLRRYLFDRFSVRLVAKLGEGVFPGVYRSAVVIVVEARPPSDDDTYVGLVISRADREALERTGAAQLASLVAERGGDISRRRVVCDPAYDISLAPDIDLAISDRMAQAASPWTGPGGIFDSHGRGEELGPDTFFVQCPSCFRWSVNPRRRAARRGGGFEDKTCPGCGLVFQAKDALASFAAVSAVAESATVPLYSGEQVSRYHLGSPMYLKTTTPGLVLKDDNLYRGPKILIRQTAVGIHAAISRDNARCTQSVYLYRPRADVGAPEFYLAQLNSRAMLFYYFILTNQTEWQSFPKLTHVTLQRLPVARADLASATGRRIHDTLVELVRAREMAMGSADDPTPEQLALDYRIEGLVMDLYRLRPDERARVNERLRPNRNIRVVRMMYGDEDAVDRLFAAASP